MRLSEKFIEYVDNTLKEEEIKLIAYPDISVPYPYPSGQMFISGCFDSDNKTLIYAKDREDWLEILVHEYCHFMQWKENCPEWINGFVKKYDCETIIDMWLNNIIELTEEQLAHYIEATRNVELDCEKRAAKMIVDFCLPIDLSIYTKRANSYILFYEVVKRCRKWNRKGFPPYSCDEIIKRMPGHFSMNYKNVSNELMEIYKSFCFGESNGTL